MSSMHTRLHRSILDEDRDGERGRAASPRLPDKDGPGRKKGDRSKSCDRGDCSRRRKGATARFPAKTIGAFDRTKQSLGSLISDIQLAAASTSDGVSLTQSASGSVTQTSTPLSAPSSAPTATPSTAFSVTSSTASTATASTELTATPSTAPTATPTSALTAASVTASTTSLTSQTPVPTVPNSTSAQPTSSSSGLPQSQIINHQLNVGAIVGGVIGGLVFILILIILGVWFVRRRKQQRIAPSQEFMHGASPPPFLRMNSGDNLGRDTSPSNTRGLLARSMLEKVKPAMGKETV